MNILYEILCVGIGGGIGAWVRSLLASKFDRQPLVFPWGTFAANMLSSFILGAMIALASLHFTSSPFDLFMDTGFCAALSTFSSLAWQMVEMMRRRRYINAIAYTTTTFVCGISLFEAANILTAYIAFL